MSLKTEQVHTLNKAPHHVYTIHYHIIQCVKYRRKVFCFPEIEEILKERTTYLCKSWNINLIAQGIDKNHIHLLLECSSNLDISKFMNNWKSSTSRYLRNRYSFLHKAINKHLWSPSYCIISTGNVSLPVVKNYVENQGKPKLNKRVNNANL